MNGHLSNWGNIFWRMMIMHFFIFGGATTPLPSPHCCCCCCHGSCGFHCYCCQGPKCSNDMGGASRALSPKTPTLRNFGDEKPQLHTLLRMRVVYHWERGNSYLRCIRVRKLVTHEDNSDKLDKVQCYFCYQTIIFALDGGPKQQKSAPILGNMTV